jgi:hypothetical protein
MAGLRVVSIDGSGWSVETLELALTGQRAGHRSSGRPVPVGDGAQLCVRRYGCVIAYCASPDDLPALGVDLSQMIVIDRWLTGLFRSRTQSSLRIPLAATALAACGVLDEISHGLASFRGERS